MTKFKSNQKNVQFAKLDHSLKNITNLRSSKQTNKKTKHKHKLIEKIKELEIMMLLGPKLAAEDLLHLKTMLDDLMVGARA